MVKKKQRYLSVRMIVVLIVAWLLYRVLDAGFWGFLLFAIVGIYFFVENDVLKIKTRKKGKRRRK